MLNFKIVPEDAIRVNNRVYFVSSTFNGLFCVDEGEEYAKYIGKIPNEDVFGSRLYSALYCIDGKYICLIPFRAKEIAIYEIYNNNFYKIPVPNSISNSDAKMMAGVIFNKTVLLFGLSDKNIYKLDIKGRECSVISSWANLIEEDMIFNKEDVFFRYQTVLYDENIYIPFCNINALLVYSIKTNNCDIKILGEQKNGYSGIAEYRNCIYCSPRDVGHHGLKLDLKTNEIELLKTSEDSIVGIYINDGSYYYCSANDYSFIRSDEKLLFDEKEGIIRLIDGGEVRKWSVLVKNDNQICSCEQFNSNFKLKEEMWFNINNLVIMLSNEK